jgi:hypothetical protein
MRKRGMGEVCTWCRRRLEPVGSHSRLAATRDHILPRSRGGSRTVWCCRQCNCLKGDMMPEDWSAFMRRNPEWWTKPQFQRGTKPPNRSGRLGPAPLTVGTEVGEVTRDDHRGRLVLDVPQAVGAGCDQNDR